MPGKTKIPNYTVHQLLHCFYQRKFVEKKKEIWAINAARVYIQTGLPVHLFRGVFFWKKSDAFVVHFNAEIFA